MSNDVSSVVITDPHNIAILIIRRSKKPQIHGHFLAIFKRWNVYTIIFCKIVLKFSCKCMTFASTNLNPILWGRGQFCPTPKFFPVISIWIKLHKCVVRYVLKIYFSCFFQQNKYSQQVTWPVYDVIMEFAINSMVKLLQN